MNIRTIVAGFLLLMCLGCWDVLKEEQHNLVGNISLINPRNQEDVGYKMIVYEDGINKNIVDDYVISISGNDAIFWIQCVSKTDCITFQYYQVVHNNGNAPLTVNAITQDMYLRAVKDRKYKYHFHSEAPACE